MANYVGTEYLWIVVTGAIVSAITAFGIGANDVANTFSAAIGARAVSLWMAILLASCLEIMGATLLGAQVTEQIKTSVLKFDEFRDNPPLLMLGMLCALIGAGVWLLLASKSGMPVSTTHSIIGALLGVGLGTGNLDSLVWSKIWMIIGSWFLAPICASVMGGTIFGIIRTSVLRRRRPLLLAKMLLPVFLFFVCSSFSFFLVFKNPFSRDEECEMQVDGRTVLDRPCYYKKWAAAHVGVASGIAIAIAFAMTVLLSLLMFRLVSKRLAARERKLALQHVKTPKKHVYGLSNFADTVYGRQHVEDHVSDGVPDRKGSAVSNDEFGVTLQNRKTSIISNNNSSPMSGESAACLIEVGGKQQSQIDTDESVFSKSLTSLSFLPSDDSRNDFVEPPISWKTRMMLTAQDTWNNMPWFKDVHAEDEDDDDLVAAIQTSAELFDEQTEICFSCFEIISSCLGCLAHSANDTANAVGPFAAILSIYKTGLDDVNVHWYILFSGGVAMALGLALLGHRVIRTMGVKLVKITPARGFSIELGAAWVVLLFSSFGFPLSTTHCAVGSTLGVGLLEPRKATDKPPKYFIGKYLNTNSVNWKLFGSVFISWVGTVAFSATVSAAIFSFAAYSPYAFHKWSD